MARKSSKNAVKKIDKQINTLKASYKKSVDDVTPVVSKKELREGIKKAEDKLKKTSSATKKTTSKNTKKSTSKSNSTKKKTTAIKKSKPVVKKSTGKSTTKRKSKASTGKVKKDDVIVAPVRKNKKSLTKKDNTNLRDKVIVSPSKTTDDVIKEYKIVENNDEKQIIEEIEEDIINGKYLDKAKALINSSSEKKKTVKRKRKGKNKFVIDLDATNEYKDLKKDVRSLYDKTNDIIEDIDKTAELSDSIKKIKLVEKSVDNNVGDAGDFLDKVSQKMLNTFIVILSIVFVILLVIVIGFIIFVSTF